MSSFPCAIPGLDLDRWTSPLSRGWGSPCQVPLATVQLSEARVSVHAGLAELIGLIMRANEAQGYHYRRADTGSYNCRANRNNPAASSWHSWAVAVDSNWSTNPMRYPVRTDRPAWEIQRWNRYGFGWGGDYDPSNPPDAMHTEFHGTPAQAQAALVLARKELGGGVPSTPSTPSTPADPGVQYSDWSHADEGVRVLELGCAGDDVAFVQRWLGLDDDGYFGTVTKARVAWYQGQRGLTVDGVVGPRTWAAMGVGGRQAPPFPLPAGHYYGPITGPNESHGGYYASERDEIAAIQAELIREGCVPGKSDPNATGWDDGRYEGATGDAVRRFQAKRGLSVDGLVGPTTWAALFGA